MQGGRVVIATFGMSSGFAVGGGIMESGNAPLQMRTPPVNGNVSEWIAPADLGDALFDGITTRAEGGATVLDFEFIRNANYAHPVLDPGATCLASDQSPTPICMVARSADAKVVSINVYPESTLNANGIRLFANALARRVLDLAGIDVQPA